MVEDFERLYRSVPPTALVRADGRIQVSASGFMDRKNEPSVDRERLLIACGKDHMFTCKGPEEGVVMLVAGAVRAEPPLEKKDSKGREVVQRFLVDVLPKPETGNCAHAEICAEPSLMPHNNVFRRLRERLARLCVVVHDPCSAAG